MRRVIVDANLLLLLVVCLGGREEIQKWNKRLSAYSVLDFDRLRGLLSDYSLVLLPHTLTEVSNMIGDVQDYKTNTARNVLQVLIKTSVEVYQPSANIVVRPEFQWLGLSDTAQLQAAEAESCALVSADGALIAAALKLGIEAFHF